MGKKSKNSKKQRRQSKSKRQLWIDAVARNENNRLYGNYCEIVVGQQVSGIPFPLPLLIGYNEKEVNAAEDYISAITNGSEQKPISFPYDNSNGSPHPCLMSLMSYKTTEYVLKLIYGQQEKLICIHCDDIDQRNRGNYGLAHNELYIDTLFFDRDDVDAWSMPAEIFLCAGHNLIDIYLARCAKLPIGMSKSLPNLRSITLTDIGKAGLIPYGLSQFYNEQIDSSPPALFLRGFHGDVHNSKGTTIVTNNPIPQELYTYPNLDKLALDTVTTYSFLASFSMNAKCLLPKSLKSISFSTYTCDEDNIGYFLLEVLPKHPCIEKIQIHGGDTVVILGNAFLDRFNGYYSGRIEDLSSSSRLKYLRLENIDLDVNVIRILLKSFPALRNIYTPSKTFSKGVGVQAIADPVIDYYRRVNSGGRYLIEREKRGNGKISLNVWPIILEQAYKNSSHFYENDEKHSATSLFYLLREGSALIGRKDLDTFHGDVENGDDRTKAQNVSTQSQSTISLDDPFSLLLNASEDGLCCLHVRGVVDEIDSSEINECLSVLKLFQEHFRSVTLPQATETSCVVMIEHQVSLFMIQQEHGFSITNTLLRVVLFTVSELVLRKESISSEWKRDAYRYFTLALKLMFGMLCLGRYASNQDHGMKAIASIQSIMVDSSFRYDYVGLLHLLQRIVPCPCLDSEFKEEKRKISIGLDPQNSLLECTQCHQREDLQAFCSGCRVLCFCGHTCQHRKWYWGHNHECSLMNKIMNLDF